MHPISFLFYILTIVFGYAIITKLSVRKYKLSLRDNCERQKVFKKTLDRQDST